MNSKKLKEQYEQLSSDYEMLGNYYESLKDQGKLIIIKIDINFE